MNTDTFTTDKEKLKALLTEWDVPFVEEKNENVIAVGNPPFTSSTFFVPSEKVTGYMGFFTAFEFTDDGKFIQMGAWE